MNSTDVNKSSSQKIKWVCFIIYLSILIYLLFFAGFLGRMQIQEEYRYNLTLFHEIIRFSEVGNKSGVWYLFLWNVVGNIVVFIPYGFFVPYLLKKGKHILSTLLLTLEFSVVVEILQLVTKHGSFDVDDILLNTIGGLCGYLVYVLWNRTKKLHEKKRA